MAGLRTKVKDKSFVSGHENEIQIEMEAKDEKIRILQNKVDSMEEVYQNVLADSFGTAIFQ